MKFRLVMIEAWRTPEGWTWNDSCTLEEEVKFEDPTSRKVLAYLRNENYLKQTSKGKVRVVMDGSEIMEVQDKSTGEPLFAFMPHVD